MSAQQVLTAQQMRAAEQALFDSGVTVSELMERAGGGAAQWVRRIAAGRAATVLCGPGNNGGDGYVIARKLREADQDVTVIAPLDPVTDAAKEARRRWGGPVDIADRGMPGEVFVDCLFGTGLTRPLMPEQAQLLRDLAARHRLKVAVDLPSGIASDDGAMLSADVPQFDVTLALGAWKFAHWSLPGRAVMGTKRLVPIGIGTVEPAAGLVKRPQLAAPAVDSHKYRRGLCAIIGGAMPGASLLAAQAAQRGGAGYVKLFAEGAQGGAPASLVIDTTPLAEAVSDARIRAVLIGPGLGRDDRAQARLATVLAAAHPVVLDADALMLLKQGMAGPTIPALATPHAGELEALCRAFGVSAKGRIACVEALARMSGMVVCAKGPDTVIAAPDGRIALARPASSWLSVAGTGDVLAGIAVSRMATGCDPFRAACEAVWLHGEAARLCGAAFTADDLALAIARAYASCV